MSTSKRARSLPFIVQSAIDPQKYVLGDQAVEMLSSVTGKVAVIAVAGGEKRALAWIPRPWRPAVR